MTILKNWRHGHRKMLLDVKNKLKDTFLNKCKKIVYYYMYA